MTLLPVALNVTGQSTLVVGGGAVAARKVVSLLGCGAHVTVIAPALNAELEERRAHFHYLERTWQSGDLANNAFALVFACTNHRDINAQISREAKEARVWCSLADDAAASDFHSAAEVRRGAICIGITTGGGSPAVSRALKVQIEECIGDEWALLLDMMSERRALLDKSATTQAGRAAIWRAILAGDVLELLRKGDRQTAIELIDALMEPKA
ncbi:MAG: precorrin-2 dehydrogenase [Abditibacteriota bacterium]|jgi:precorrin-2 dehydrogenase/sirohydrochlorin ferrochelatase|nr:precorrin-2 dehydrogenase [Abditibacteriota bacterium]